MTHNYVNEFHDSMNEHRNAEYKAVPPFVIENEHHRKLDGDDRGHLRVWERPKEPADPREDRWSLVGRRFGTYTETSEIFDSITEADDVQTI